MPPPLLDNKSEMKKVWRTFLQSCELVAREKRRRRRETDILLPFFFFLSPTSQIYAFQCWMGHRICSSEIIWKMALRKKLAFVRPYVSSTTLVLGLGGLMSRRVEFDLFFKFVWTLNCRWWSDSPYKYK